MPYTNPVIPGFHPDPSVCRVGADYYLVTSSFEYYPGVPIFHSRDLFNWRQIGYCLTRESQLPLHGARSSGGIFAPTIRYHQGRFYMATTNITVRKHLVVHAEDPEGPWSEPVWLDMDGIDPSLLFDDDGKVYFSSTGPGGICQSELDVERGTWIGEKRFLWAGTGGSYPEAPHLYRLGDTYYLLLAEGGTEYGHMVTIARSNTPWGPFEPCPHNPILSHRSKSLEIRCTGHGDLIQDHRGDWWIVFLATRPVGYPPCYHLGRETFLAPVAWDQAGWPVVNEGRPVEPEMRVTTLPPHPWKTAPAKDDFDAHALGMCWNFLRTPHPVDWSLTARPGHLRLVGSAVTLDQEDSPAFVGRRQQHFSFSASAGLDFDPQGENEEAGLTVLMNHRHHYEVFVARQGDERRVRVRRRIGSLVSIVADVPAPAGGLALSISADSTTYAFAVEDGSGNRQQLATGETRYLSTEVAGGFTGVYIGMYATGNGTRAAAPADFDWFEYTHS